MSELPDDVVGLVEKSISDNTRRAYRADLAHFEAWGGQLPADPGAVASYLAAHAETLSVATLVRRMATISKAHEARGLPNPCRSEIVRATLRGVKRTRGIAQREAKPLLKEDCFGFSDAIGDGVKGARDRALLLIGFAGGFRRSELVGLDCADIEHVRQGVVITLRRSKTIRKARGEGLAYLTPDPALSGRRPRQLAFHFWGRNRPRLPAGRSASARRPRAVVRRSRIANCQGARRAAGIDASGFSGHSLRAGFATSATQAGVSSLKIRAQTGHASDAMLARYVREGEMFAGNAAGALL